MYIFTPPAAAYDVTFTAEGLQAFLEAGRSKSSRKIGKTVTVILAADVAQVWLYNTHIGSVYLDGSKVWISPDIDAHGSQATTWWVQKLLQDNQVGGFVCRENGHYAVAGRTFTK